MSQPNESLSLSAEHRIDDVCARFETACKAGERPCLEDHLGQVEEAERPALLRELLRLELFYRVRAGETPRLDEYRLRFPDSVELLLSLLAADDTDRSGGQRTVPGVPAAAGGTALPALPGYEVLEELGHGGMGVVYKARDTRLNRLVAIKRILGGTSSEEHRLRFRSEAEAVARLSHPHVVQIHASGEHDGHPFFVMEFVPGSSLAQALAGGPQPPREAARMVLLLARAVHAAHQKGIVHRDLKPANVLLASPADEPALNTAWGWPKVSDFGLARHLDAGQRRTADGVVVGTPAYMAPEQAAGRSQEIGPATDVYALGVILYEMLTGRVPFQGDDLLGTLSQVLTKPPQPPRQLQAGVPASLEAVCLKCLEKAAADRYSSAAAVADDLERFLGDEPVHVLKRRRLPRRVWWAAAAAALFVAASLLSALWPAGGTPSVSPDPLDARMTEPKTRLPAGDPRVLTVSQRPQDGGQFRTINEALDRVKPKMTIQVLDDADYEEALLISRPEQHREVVLEAKGKATIRKVAGKTGMVWIRGVPGFTLRGFRFVSGREPHAQVHISGRCPGVIVDRLDMACEAHHCIELVDVPLSGKDAPIVIQNCTIRSGKAAVFIVGHEDENPCGHVVIRNNTLVGCTEGVCLIGAVHKVLVVGNRILETSFGHDLADLLPGTADVLIANNTLWRNRVALRVFNDSTKAKEFLKCKNIRFQNNLVLSPLFPADLLFKDKARDKPSTLEDRPGDLALLKSPQWRFSHNWREIDPMKAATADPNGSWIPRCPNDQLKVPIELLSREWGNPNFLRPARDSPLARGGAGVTDSSLPAYVGAVPAEGAEPWDWDKTWAALAR
jgi:serine/threonine protein kinase